MSTAALLTGFAIVFGLVVLRGIAHHLATIATELRKIRDEIERQGA